jgi:predicted RecB family endonuclease
MMQETELQWRTAPVRTEWGDGMMVADVELSKDETLTLYAHESALHLVRGVSVGQEPELPALPSPLELARQFHEAYERLAPKFGYETRTETRVLDLKSANGALMVAVCDELLMALQDQMRAYATAAVLHATSEGADMTQETEPPALPEPVMEGIVNLKAIAIRYGSARADEAQEDEPAHFARKRLAVSESLVALFKALDKLAIAAVLAERERCARICELWNATPGERLVSEIRGKDLT